MGRETVTYECGAPDCSNEHTAEVYGGDLVPVGDSTLERRYLPKYAVENDDLLLLMDGGFNVPDAEHGVIHSKQAREECDSLLVGSAEWLGVLRCLPGIGWEVMAEMEGDFHDTLVNGRVADIGKLVKELLDGTVYKTENFTPVKLGDRVVVRPSELLAAHSNQGQKLSWWNSK